MLQLPTGHADPAAFRGGPRVALTTGMINADVGELPSLCGVPEPIEPECTRIMRRLPAEDPKPIPAPDPGDGEPTEWAKCSMKIAIPCEQMMSIAHEKTTPAPRAKKMKPAPQAKRAVPRKRRR